MRIDDLDYDLPGELIAQAPLGERDASRLLVLRAGAEVVRHHAFREIPSLLPDGAIVVVNDSRVFPARIACRKPTGGRSEVLLVRRLGGRGVRERWLAIVGSGGRVREGLRLETPSLSMEVAGRDCGPGGGGEPIFAVEIEARGGTVSEAVAREGSVPLPPYIRRPPCLEDEARYQTVYADEEGSAAAPTAGLHFTPALLGLLAAADHPVLGITLHVGPGTFRPVRTARLEDHVMHEEWARIPAPTASAIEAGKREGRSVVAVGTTVVRALESAAAAGKGTLAPWEGMAGLFIRPGFRFAVVDHLVTNFHLPRSTLIALVMAIAGRDLLIRAYAEAVRERYRFYSYGDAMLVIAGRAGASG